MIKYKKIALIVALILVITGCGSKEADIESIEASIQKLGNLTTYEAYYHNVAKEYKKKGTGIENWFEKDRELWFEYTGKVSLSVDLSQIKLEQKGNTITVYIPKAEVKDATVDKDGIDPKDFIQSKDGFLNKNKITSADADKALAEAQKEMEKTAKNDEELLDMAQKRAVNIIEGYITNLKEMTKTKYEIEWLYENNVDDE